MHIKKHHGYNPPKYFVAERSERTSYDEELLVDCGTEPPTFNYPELHNGLCENVLPDIPDGSVDLIIDDPP